MAYTNSKLVDYTNLSPNRDKNRNHEIDTITIHCMVAQWTAKTACDFFSRSSVQASANYCVGYDGSIGLSVPEKDRSWCTSSASNDNRAVTIEVASEMKHPYKVTAKAYDALIDLVADICKRNNIKELKWEGNKAFIGQIKKQNMTVHRWFANKSCPGQYLYDLHGEIAADVNAKLAGKKDAEAAKQMFRIQVGSYTKKANAVTLYNKVKKAGFDAIVVEVNDVYKVQVGAYSKKANATSQLKKVKKAGFEGFITTRAGKQVAVTGTTKVKKAYSGKFPVLPKKGYLASGDTGVQVGRLQEFLNWYGNYGLKVDKSFGDKTEKAVEDFQKKEGLVSDGEFGGKSLAKAKTIKK